VQLFGQGADAGAVGFAEVIRLHGVLPIYGNTGSAAVVDVIPGNGPPGYLTQDNPVSHLPGENIPGDVYFMGIFHNDSIGMALEGAAAADQYAVAGIVQADGGFAGLVHLASDDVDNEAAVHIYPLSSPVNDAMADQVRNPVPSG